MGSFLYLCFFALGPIYWLPNVSPAAMQILKFALFAAICIRLGWKWVQSGGRLSRKPFFLLSVAIAAIILCSVTHDSPIDDIAALGNYALPLIVVGVVPLLSMASRTEIEMGLRGAPVLFACIAILVPLGLVFPALNWMNPFSLEIHNFEGSQTFTGFGGSRTGWSLGASFLGALALANVASSDGKGKKWNFLIVVIIGAATFIPGGRVGMAAFALMLISIVALGALRKSTVRTSLYWLGITFVTVLVALTFAEELRLASLFTGDLREGTTGRTEGWKFGLDIFMSNPIFGIGEYEADLIGRAEGYGAVHNVLLNYLVKYGVVGTLPMLAFFLWLFVRIYSRRRDALVHYPTLVAALMFASTSAIVWLEPYAVFGAFFNALVFWFAVGIFLARRSIAVDPARAPVARRRLRFVWR